MDQDVGSPQRRGPGWSELVQAWIDVIDEEAPSLIEGLYVVGSIALDDWQPHHSDIDIIAVTSEPADDVASGTLRSALAMATDRLQRAVGADHQLAHQPAHQPGVDGPFLAWGDLTTPPVGVSRPWVLDGAFHHDAECFEINPVTWYTLATYGIRVRGPRPNELPIPLDAIDRIGFVRSNAATYWTDLLGSLRGSLTELGPDDTLPSSVPQWCLLGPCRMLYTATTGDVASKSAAGRWAAEVMGGEHATAILEAVRLRSEPEQPVGMATLRASAAAMAHLLDRINPKR